MTLERLWDQ